MNPAIESKLSGLSKQRAKAIAGIEAERAAWMALDEINPPELPRFVQTSARPAGSGLMRCLEKSSSPIASSSRA